MMHTHTHTHTTTITHNTMKKSSIQVFMSNLKVPTTSRGTENLEYTKISLAFCQTEKTPPCSRLQLRKLLDTNKMDQEVNLSTKTRSFHILSPLKNSILQKYHDVAHFLHMLIYQFAFIS